MTMNLGSGFGAIPKTKIIRELRDYYDGITFIKEDGSEDNTSCNSHSYHVLKKWGVMINDQLQNVGGMNIYPMIFQGANQHTKRYIKQIKHFGYTMEICRGLREKVWKERMRYAVNRNFYKRVL